MIDKRKVKKVGIDDFAIKRGQRYGSIMIDLETHKVVDMLSSREPEKVEKMAKGIREYPNGIKRRIDIV